MTRNLRNPTKPRIDKIFGRVHVVEILSYFLVGMAGYLLLSEYIEERAINSMVMASIQTIPMSVGKFTLVLAIFFVIPINIFPSRDVVYDMLNLERNNKNHVIISLVMAFSGTAVAIFFQNINSYLGALGGTAGVMMTDAIPMICYYKLIGVASFKEKLMVAFMTVVSLAGMVGGVLSVVYPR